MLIKEYRIPVPMTVDEYRIAQLYMIVVGTKQSIKSILSITRELPMYFIYFHLDFSNKHER